MKSVHWLMKNFIQKSDLFKGQNYQARQSSSFDQVNPIMEVNLNLYHSETLIFTAIFLSSGLDAKKSGIFSLNSISRS